MPAGPLACQQTAPARPPPAPQQFLFLKQKCRSLYNQRKRPAKIAWTTLYRKAHRKASSTA